MRTIQLYATGSATANAVAQIVIPSATTLKLCQVALMVDSVTDNASVRIDISKVPTTQVASNGAQDSFLQTVVLGNFVTSGLSQWGLNKTFPLSVQCRQGEIIYLHATVAGTIVYYWNGIFWY